MQTINSKEPIISTTTLDPNRSPRWRFEHATEIHRDHGGRYHSGTDARTIEFVKYLAFRNKLNGKHLKETVVLDIMLLHFPTIQKTVRLHNSSISFMIEARVLAGQSAEQIAELYCEKPEVIVAFEQLFFDVRDRLLSADFVNECVIGPVTNQGVDSVSREQTAKYLAYYHGPVALNQFLYGCAGRNHLQSEADLDGHLTHQIANAVKLQALLVGVRMRPTKFDTHSVVNSYLHLQQQDSKISGAHEQSEWIAEFTEVLRRKSPIPRGSDADDLPADSPLRNYSIGTVELRADEQLRATSRGGLPYIHQLRDFRPDTVNREAE